jgi:hypothetical protein
LFGFLASVCLLLAILMTFLPVSAFGDNGFVEDEEERHFGISIPHIEAMFEPEN